MNIASADHIFATSVLQIIIGVAILLIGALVAWIAKTLLKVGLVVDRLERGVFPEDKKSLPDQVEEVRDDVHLLRVTGSNRLQEIVNEARLSRTEATAERISAQRERALAEAERARIQEVLRENGG